MVDRTREAVAIGDSRGYLKPAPLRHPACPPREAGGADPGPGLDGSNHDVESRKGSINVVEPWLRKVITEKGELKKENPLSKGDAMLQADGITGIRKMSKKIIERFHWKVKKAPRYRK